MVDKNKEARGLASTKNIKEINGIHVSVRLMPLLENKNEK